MVRGLRTEWGSLAGSTRLAIHHSSNELLLLRDIRLNDFLFPILDVPLAQCDYNKQYDCDSNIPVEDAEARPVPRPSSDRPIGERPNSTESENDSHDSPQQYKE